MARNAYGKKIVEEGVARDWYDEMLDDVFPETMIAGHLYQTSRAFKEVDPIAYRVGFSDFVGTQEDWDIE